MNKEGYFGNFGGRFVPEALRPPLMELEEAMATIMPSREYRDALQDLLVKEGEFNASLLQLKKNLYEDPSNDKGALSAACDAAQELNTTLMQMRRRLLDALKDFPAYNGIWAPLVSSCNKLQ